MRCTKTRYAWAIKRRYGNILYEFIGHGYFGWPSQPHLSGLPIALFPSRKLAREARRKYHSNAPLKVVRVKVTIEEMTGKETDDDEK